MDETHAQWLERANTFGRRAMLRQDLVRAWATECSEAERRFFISLYEHRLQGAAGGAAGGPNQGRQGDYAFSDLTREGQYLVGVACRRIWGHAAS